MPLAKHNVLIWTARGSFNAQTYGSSRPTPVLSAQIAWAEQPPATQVEREAPSLVMKTVYLVRVDRGIDIRENDRITSILREVERSAWPDDAPPPGEPGSESVSYIVRFVRNKGAGPFETRNCYVERMVKGGPRT